MCMELFVGANAPLTTIPYAPSNVFSAFPSRPELQPVHRLLTETHRYELASVQGCACGFRYAPSDLEILHYDDIPAEVKEDVRTDYEARRESVRLLREYLRLALDEVSTVTVYSCWTGDEEKEPQTRQEVTLDYFDGDHFHLVER